MLRWAFVGVLFLTAVGAAAHVRTQSGICFDEPKRLASSLTMLEHGVFAARDGTPLSIVYGLPFSGAERASARDWDPQAVRADFAVWDYGIEFLTRRGPQDALPRARFPTVIAFALLLALVVWEGHRLAGPSGACAALALVSTSPALLSHAGLVSPDLLATTACVAFTMALRSSLDRGGTTRFATTAVLAGIAIATKLTCVAVVVAACLAAALPRERRWSRIVGAGAAAVLGVLVAEMIYRAFGASLSEPIEAARTFASTELVTYFLGDLRHPGFAFYPVILLAKATPLWLGALALTGVLAALDRRNRPKIGSAFVAHAMPALGLLGALVLSDYPQGYRFLLPAFALLALAATPGLARVLDHASRSVRVLGWSAIVAQAIATASTHPDHLAYWNVFAGGFDGGSRIAVDSNADWGQATPALLRYAKAEGVDTVFALLNTIEPAQAPLVGLPALAARLATGDPLSSCAIAVSVTYLRTTRCAAVEGSNPVFSFVRALDELPHHAAPGHAIHVWRFTPDVEALAREHLGKFSTR